MSKIGNQGVTKLKPQPSMRFGLVSVNADRKKMVTGVSLCYKETMELNFSQDVNSCLKDKVHEHEQSDTSGSGNKRVKKKKKKTMHV